MNDELSNIKYVALFDEINAYVATFSTDLSSILDSASGKEYMTGLISQYLAAHGFEGKQSALVERLYQDMAGNGCLQTYFDMPDFEEANINAWNEIHIRLTGRRFIAPETFLSPAHAQNVINRILSRVGKTMDESVPRALANLGDGLRIAAHRSPIAASAAGATASIRLVNSQVLSETEIVKSTAATPEILDFLYFCIYNGVSVCFAGAPGSGKTTMLNWLLSKIPNEERILTIEEDSREFDLKKYDADGNPLNDVVNMLARPSDNPQSNCDTSILLDDTLRMDGDYIAVGEMRSKEAYTAIKGAGTGVPLMTTIHSNSAPETYRRMMVLAMRDPECNFNNETLMQLLVQAFPIVVYMKQCRDGKRRIMEVMEGEDYSIAKGLTARSIYRFCVDRNEIVNKKTVIHGRHRRVGEISKHLQQALLNNGAENALVDTYAMPVNRKEAQP